MAELRRLLQVLRTVGSTDEEALEAGMIAGLTAAGIPDTVAVAATITQRLFTCYLPPIWGYPTLAWMRRREYL
jgi:hypothetical protein